VECVSSGGELRPARTCFSRLRSPTALFIHIQRKRKKKKKNQQVLTRAVAIILGVPVVGDLLKTRALLWRGLSLGSWEDEAAGAP
jgi:hypothetical protein